MENTSLLPSPGWRPRGVIFEQSDFANTLARMDKAGVLYKICQNFAAIDLHPDAVPERVMSNV